MKACGLDVYTPEIGKRFVEHCANELRICSSRISRAKNITEKFNRLLQGLDGKDALLPDLTKKFELPHGFTEALNAYLAHSAAKGNMQSTIHAQYLVCGKFLKNLYALGCTEISDVTGENIQSDCAKAA